MCETGELGKKQIVEMEEGQGLGLGLEQSLELSSKPLLEQLPLRVLKRSASLLLKRLPEPLPQPPTSRAYRLKSLSFPP